MEELIPIKLVVNGVEREVYVKPWETLLEVLRDKLLLKSVKAGCLRGECGTCIVIMDNKLVKSCLVLAVEADGSEITTLEGLSDIGKPHIVQKAFIEKFGFQCGYCTPAFILIAYWLLKNKPSASREEVMELVNSVLCRCTGYKQVIESIEYALENR